MLVTKQLTVAIDFHCFLSIQWKSMGPIKENLRESKWWNIFFISSSEDIFQNAHNRTAVGTHWPPLYGKNTMEVNGHQKLIQVVEHTEVE